MISENDQRFLSGFFEAMKDMRFPASVAEYRSMIDGIDPLKNSPPLPEVGSYHESVELRAGLNSAIAVPKTNGPFPVFVICHGNGGIWGSSHSYRRLTRDVACAGYLAITPDYRLAPEHKFPAGFEDMKYAVHWAYENAKRVWWGRFARGPMRRLNRRWAGILGRARGGSSVQLAEAQGGSRAGGHL
jgi:acetyl esterase/lipase